MSCLTEVSKAALGIRKWENNMNDMFANSLGVFFQLGAHSPHLHGPRGNARFLSFKQIGGWVKETGGEEEDLLK